MDKTVAIPVGPDQFQAQIILESLKARGFNVQLWDANNHSHGPLDENRLIVLEQDREEINTFLHEEGFDI